MHTRAVSPLLAKDAAGTPEVPAPVVHEGGKAMLSHSLIAKIEKEPGTAADECRDGNRDAHRGPQRGKRRDSARQKESETQRQKKKSQTQSELPRRRHGQIQSEKDKERENQEHKARVRDPLPAWPAPGCQA